MSGKVTVILVTYNCKETVKVTLDSIVGQSTKQKELVVVDGASTDGTLDIINNYKDSIDVFVSEPDRGIYDAMNKAIKLSSGDWICFMNAGDTFNNENVIEEVIAIPNIENYDVIYGDTKIIDKVCEYIRTPHSLDTFNMRLPFCHQSSFVKSELMKEKLYDLQYKVCADFHFFYTLFKEQRKFLYVPIVVSVYNQADGGFSAKNRDRLIYEQCKVSASNKLQCWIKYYRIKLTIYLVNIRAKVMSIDQEKRCIEILKADNHVRGLKLNSEVE